MLIVISVCDLLRIYFFLIPYSFFHVFPLRSPYRNYSPCLLPIHISVPDLPLIPHSFSIYALAVPNLFTISPVSSSFMSHVFPRLSQFIPHFFPLPFTPPVICDFTPHFRSLDVFAIYSIRFWFAIDVLMGLGPATHFSSLPRCFPCFLFILHLCSLFFPLLLVLFNFVDLYMLMRPVNAWLLCFSVWLPRLTKDLTLWSPVHVSLTLMGMIWEQMLVSSWQLVNATAILVEIGTNKHLTSKVS